MNGYTIPFERALAIVESGIIQKDIKDLEEHIAAIEQYAFMKMEYFNSPEFKKFEVEAEENLLRTRDWLWAHKHVKQDARIDRYYTVLRGQRVLLQLLQECPVGCSVVTIERLGQPMPDYATKLVEAEHAINRIVQEAIEFNSALAKNMKQKPTPPAGRTEKEPKFSWWKK